MMSFLFVLMAVLASPLSSAASDQSSAYSVERDKCLADTSATCTWGDVCSIECAVDLTKKYDELLNATYKTLRSRLKGTEADSKLLASERAWVKSLTKKCVDDGIKDMDKQSVMDAHLQLSGAENSCTADETWDRLQFLKRLASQPDANKILSILSASSHHSKAKNRSASSAGSEPN